jgi:hypothetical protein
LSQSALNLRQKSCKRWARALNGIGAKAQHCPALSTGQPPCGRSLWVKLDIPKRIVWEAYQRVKANRGAAGVDNQSIEAFDRDVKNNLFKLWNRLSSGGYFPSPVKRVAITKRQGAATALRPGKRNALLLASVFSHHLMLRPAIDLKTSRIENLTFDSLGLERFR